MITILGADSFIHIIKEMHERGEVSLSQYAQCLRNYSQVPKNKRKDIHYYKEGEYV